MKIFSRWFANGQRLLLGGGLLLHAPATRVHISSTIFPANRVTSAVNQRLLQPTLAPTRVTLVLRDSTLEYVVRALARQANVRLVYDNTNPLFAQTVSAHVTDVPIMDAFSTVLQGTGLRAQIAPGGEVIVIRPTSAVAKRAGGVVTGEITDSVTGAGLAGATIHIAGTRLSALSSDSGHFTLKGVPAGEQLLTVRFFGYKPVERSITVVDSERTVVRIAMVSIPTVLSGVVTTAAGVQRKVEVGNDITTLNVDSIMQTAPISSVTDLLETRVPGLTVQHSSGIPGAPARLRLRGVGSVQLNNDPIVIVDGVRVYGSQSDPRNNNLAPSLVGGSDRGGVNVGNTTAAYSAPSPLDQIDPANISTIEVFKGPSASALYGSDAANGVIVITTKHGRAGPTHWSLGLGAGINWIPGDWPTNYLRFGTDTTINFSGLCAWTDSHCLVDSVVAFQALTDPRYSLLSHGNDEQANVNISGGVPTLQYSLTGTGAGDLGNLKLPTIERQRYADLYGPVPDWMLRPDNYKTWGLGGSLTALPTPAVRVTLQSTLFNSAQQRSSLESAVATLAGEYINPSYIVENGSLLPTATSPIIDNDVERATDNQTTSTNVSSMHWQPVSWLPLDATAGINTIQRNDETYIPFGVNSAGPGVALSDTTGSYGLGRGTSRDQTVTLATALPFRYLSVAVGGNLYSESIADLNAYTNQLAPGVSVPTTFPTNTTGYGGISSTFGQTSTSQSTYGWYVEPRFNLASRLFIAPGFRLDGGSGGATSAGSVGGLSAFPKIDLSYLAIDRQDGPPMFGVITQLRPRLALGVAGTQPAPADKLRLFNVGDYQLVESGGSFITSESSDGCKATLTLDGTTSVPAVCLNALGNTQLRPERSTEFEGGVDATLWRGRMTLTYTQYDKTRKDAILAIPIAPSISGYDGQNFNIEKNIGVIRNTGTEIEAKATLVQRRAMSWDVGAQFSNDNNLVVRLNRGQAPLCYGDMQVDPCQGTRIVAGYPLFGIWEQPISGFTDLNHDGVIEPNEVRLADSAVYVGQPEPKYQLNFTSDLSLLDGRLSVHVTFAYQNGLTQTNDAALQSGAFMLLPNTPNTPLATQAAVVEASCYSALNQIINGCTNHGSLFGLLQTVNTFRFNTLSVNYEIPRHVTAWLRVPRATLALQGENLALRSNYHGGDPDVNAFSTVSAGDETADTGQIPEPRTWWLRLTLGN